jgi:hypothetical protein
MHIIDCATTGKEDVLQAEFVPLKPPWFVEKIAEIDDNTQGVTGLKLVSGTPGPLR